MDDFFVAEGASSDTCCLCKGTKNLTVVLEEPERKLMCNDCHEKCKTHYAMKCLKCGADGFIPRSLANKVNLEKAVGMIMDEDKIVIVPWQQCPACIKSDA